MNGEKEVFVDLGEDFLVAEMKKASAFAERPNCGIDGRRGRDRKAKDPKGWICGEVFLGRFERLV